MIETNTPRFLNDYEDVVRLYVPAFGRDSSVPACEVLVDDRGDSVSVTAVCDEKRVCRRVGLAARNDMERLRLVKRAAKHTLYLALSARFDKTLPWGSLSGIRPTHNGYLLREEGKTDVAAALIEEFGVEASNARLVAEIMRNQDGYRSDPATDAALYLHVPVCPSRCYYCSFVSVTADKCRCLPAYARALARDAVDAVGLAGERGLRLSSIYMGGGTPTVLSPDLLACVLDAVPKSGVEFTVEAGRPDTLTKEHLSVMQAAGVTRVSVNPQTFCDATLIRIGRRHSAKDTVRAFYAAKEAGFSVNMDLIAGLDGETDADFAATLEKTLELRPDNVTVHTLCLKRGSDAHTRNLDIRAAEPLVKRMTDAARNALGTAGYLPYYLYRQKHMLDNLQNVGYALPGAQCRNNIDTMEERASVIACGSGAISKRVTASGRIERAAMVKPIEAYLDRFDEMIARRKNLFAASAEENLKEENET